MPSYCKDCGFTGFSDDFDVITESEILRGDAAGIFDSDLDVEAALEDVDKAQCPECGSLEVFGVFG